MRGRRADFKFGSERFHPWPEFDLPGPCSSGLPVDVEVGFGNRVRRQKPVFAASGGPWVVGSADATIDDEMADMDVLWMKLARHGLRQTAKPEFAHRERR